MGQWTYFSDDEGKGMDKELMAMLDMARSKANVPFVITCGLRTQSENDALKESVKDSAHLTGHAVDLACVSSPDRYKIITALLSVGFTRIGIYSAHLHCDNDPTKPANVMWYVQGT